MGEKERAAAAGEPPRDLSRKGASRRDRSPYRELPEGYVFISDESDDDGVSSRADTFSMPGGLPVPTTPAGRRAAARSGGAAAAAIASAAAREVERQEREERHREKERARQRDRAERRA